MANTGDFQLEAEEALERVWFVQSLEITPHLHRPLPAGLEPKPLLKFLARVEELLLQHDLL